MAKKVLYTLEYPIKCSPSILYEFLSTPAGLQEWFADKVDERDHVFHFGWNGYFEHADILDSTENEFVKYRWHHADGSEFFEFRIEVSPITNETILKVTDFAEKGEIKDQSQLWDTQIADLKHRIGS